MPVLCFGRTIKELLMVSNEQKQVLRAYLTTGRDQREGVLNLDQTWLKLSSPRATWGQGDIAIRELNPRKRLMLARYIARTNIGLTEIEMARPVATVEKFLDGLRQIEGLCSVEQADMYTLGFRSAELFNLIEIGIRIASLVQSIFFESLDLEYSASMGMVNGDPRERMSMPAREFKQIAT
jgi:hypothetical protein